MSRKLKKVIYIFVFFYVIVIKSQTDGVYAIADTMPVFPGGNVALGKFIQSHLNYPVAAREQNRMGKAIVQFIVDTSGKAIDPKIIKTSDHADLDKEAMTIVSKFPAWKPGYDKGKKVKVMMNIPITFKNTGLARNKEEAEINEALVNRQFAEREYEKGNLLEAVKYYNQAISHYAADDKARYKKAQILLELKKYDEACETLKEFKSHGRNEADELIAKHCK